MQSSYELTFREFEVAFAKLESMVPKPELINIGKSQGFRYTDQSIYQAIILKLARYVSGLYSAEILLNARMLQEQGVIHRTLDEFFQDIKFLTYAITHEEITEKHKAYLEEFYVEEFDVRQNKYSQKRSMVLRKHIRAFIARMEGEELNPSRGIELWRTLYQAYSGYVHGSAPAIMEMYGGSPPRFHLRGLLGSSLVNDHRNDIWNYFYRGILAFAFAGNAFGDQELVDQLLCYKEQFEKAAGKNYD